MQARFTDQIEMAYVANLFVEIPVPFYIFTVTSLLDNACSYRMFDMTTC